MKAITPIVSTIILLLITVAIAGTAYVYITGVTGPLTSKDFFVVIGSESCAANKNVKLSIANTGTAELTEKDVIISDIDGKNVAIQPFSIGPGQGAEITIRCGSSLCPKGPHTLKMGTATGAKMLNIFCEPEGAGPSGSGCGELCNDIEGYQYCVSQDTQISGMVCTTTDGGRAWDCIPCEYECIEGDGERCDMP